MSAYYIIDKEAGLYLDKYLKPTLNMDEIVAFGSLEELLHFTAVREIKLGEYDIVSREYELDFTNEEETTVIYGIEKIEGTLEVTENENRYTEIIERVY